jgi:undecaprenyl-diphosphatase
MTTREKRFWTGAALVTGEMLGTLAVFTAVVSGIVLLIRPGVRKYKRLDLAIFDKLAPHINERNNELMIFFTKLGKHQFLVPANLSLIAFYLFIRKHSWFSIRVAGVAISSLLLMIALKKFFRRKRPVNPVLEKARGLSFPSGHAIMSVTFYGLIVYILTQEIKSAPLRTALIIPLILLMQAIGFSRVYLRVHYPSDVVAGHLIGLGWLLTALGVLEKLETYNKQKVGQTFLTFATEFKS